MRKILVLLILLAVSLVLSEGLPVTALREAGTVSPPELPWLAHWHEMKVCDLAPMSEDDDYVYRAGCYIVPNATRDEVLWGVTQAMRQSHRWRLLAEHVVRPEGHPATILQVWQETLLTDWVLSLQFPLDGEPRFTARLAYPSGEEH